MGVNTRHQGVHSFFYFHNITAQIATESDIPTIEKLVNEGFSYQDDLRGRPRVTESELSERIKTDPFYIFKSNDKIIACVTTWLNSENQYHFGLLVVDKPSRGSGVTGAIINAVEADASSKGYKELFLSYMTIAPQLKQYYKNYEFKETGKTYQWEGLNIAEMSKTLR